MKKNLILLLTFALATSSFALYGNSQINERFLFNDFDDGIVYFDTGHVTKAKLNYGTVSQLFYFVDKDSSVLVLKNISEITAIVIADHTFEKVKGGKFYEKIPIGNNFLYVNWKNKLISAKIGAYGTENSIAPIDNYYTLSAGSANYINALKFQENVKVLPANRYYIKEKGKFRSFSSFKELARIFKVSVKIMDRFVKYEKLNFNNVEDVEKAFMFAIKLVPKKYLLQQL